MVHAEQVVVDHALDEVEDAPAGEHEAEVEAPVGSQPTLSPGDDGGDRPAEHEEPGRDVEEPVSEVFASRPASVVIGYPSTWLTMWCH